MNHNAAKLTTSKVQHARDLYRFGFRSSNIGNAFGVCHRAIADVVHKRSWSVIPDVPTSLPLLDVHAAMELRLRSMRRVEELEVIHYAELLSTHLDLPLTLILLAWTRAKQSNESERRTERGTAEGYGGLKAVELTL